MAMSCPSFINNNSGRSLLPASQVRAVQPLGGGQSASRRPMTGGNEGFLGGMFQDQELVMAAAVLALAMLRK
jgi:hypothetical protein